MTAPFITLALFDETGTQQLATLATAYARQWLDERDGLGSFSFSIPYEDSTAIRPGRIVKFAYGHTSAAWVWGGVVESITVTKTGASAGGDDRVADVSGRGLRALLEGALVFPVGTATTRSFTNRSAGYIMSSLLGEAHLRGALTAISASFTDTTDSNGAPFATELTVSEDVGATLAAVADHHVELAVDVAVTPDMRLHYYNTMGTDRTVQAQPVVLRIGGNVSELAVERSGPVRNTVLVAYNGDQYTEKVDTSSVDTYGRQETYLNLQSTDSLTQAQLAATQVLTTSATPADGITLTVQPDDAQPYLDWGVGDWVWVVENTGQRTRYRVQAISVAEDDNNNVAVVPELGTLRADLTRRLNRALAQMEAGKAEGKSTSGTQLITNPLTGFTGLGQEPASVISYDTTTKTAVVSLNGSEQTVHNYTGFTLNALDVVAVTTLQDGTGTKAAIGLQRNVPSSPPPYVTPLFPAGFPLNLTSLNMALAENSTSPTGFGAGNGIANGHYTSTLIASSASTGVRALNGDNLNQSQYMQSTFMYHPYIASGYVSADNTLWTPTQADRTTFVGAYTATVSINQFSHHRGVYYRWDGTNTTTSRRGLYRVAADTNWVEQHVVTLPPSDTTLATSAIIAVNDDYIAVIRQGSTQGQPATTGLWAVWYDPRTLTELGRVTNQTLPRLFGDLRASVAPDGTLLIIEPTRLHSVRYGTNVSTYTGLYDYQGNSSTIRLVGGISTTDGYSAMALAISSEAIVATAMLQDPENTTRYFPTVMLYTPTGSQVLWQDDSRPGGSTNNNYWPSAARWLDTTGGPFKWSCMGVLYVASIT